MIKVLLERKVEKKNLDKLVDKIKDLRALALRQPGYITGETFFSGEDPVVVLVIATCLNEEYLEAMPYFEDRPRPNQGYFGLFLCDCS